MGDITRNIFNPAKHYSGVRMQQGRVFLEHDANENEQICAEKERRALRDIVGPTGTPDDGFQIFFANGKPECAEVENGAQSFLIQRGTYYLDGLRVELEVAEWFTDQSDWLAGPAQTSVALADDESERLDLVYLEAWEQEVSAVEDDELFEKALGGPDTSTRLRIMHRVQLTKGGANLTEALETARRLAQRAAEARTITLKVESADTGGSAPNANDLCQPYVAAGYLGAENQALRVQLLGDKCFTWGFDNASMLYRVKVTRNGNKDVVSFVTEPRDEYHWPTDNQVVEILPWACALVNGEVIAEITGHLTTVTKVEDSAGKRLVLTENLPLNFQLSSQKRADQKLEGKDYLFMRVWDRGDDTSQPAKIKAESAGNALGHTGLKVVFGGSGGLPGDYWVIGVRPETPDVVIPRELREPTPPQGIERHLAPLALIRWTKGSNGKVVGTILYDLRDKFHPLTRKSTCCSCTVGDGLTSHGDFNRLEDAVAFLENQESGKICLLPGLHRTAARIDKRKDLLIEGCGQRSVLVPLENADAKDPLLTITDSTNITIADVEMLQPEGSAVLIKGSQADNTRGIRIAHTGIIAGVTAIVADNVADLTIEDNRLAVLDRPEGQRVLSLRAENCLIRRNTILTAPAEQAATPGAVEPGPALIRPSFPIARMSPALLQLHRLAQRVWPVAATVPAAPYQALGGIHLRGGSRNVTVCENAITGGRADGITIGETLPLPKPKETVALGPRNIVTVLGLKNNSGIILRLADPETGETIMASPTDNAGKSTFSSHPHTSEISIHDPEYTVKMIEVQRPSDWESHVTVHVEPAAKSPAQEDRPALYVYDVTLEKNDIQHMGLSGIGTRDLCFDKTKESELRSYMESGFHYGGIIRGLTIRDNTIRRCLQNPFDQTLKTLATGKGLGGISIGVCENAIIQGNLIEDNGTNHVDPVCGIYIGSGELLDITHNRITGNGKVLATMRASPQLGKRGGIVVDHAAAAIQMNPIDAGDPDPNVILPDPVALRSRTRVYRPFGTPAARIHDNVVDQPIGLALSVTALGPVSVQANFCNAELAVAGASANLAANDLAGTVWIQDLAGFRLPLIDLLDADVDSAKTAPGKLKAQKPVPADGDVTVTMPLLQWTAGETALCHNVYLGTSRDLKEADLKVSRLPTTLYYHVPGLTPGTTYYWRVDEIDKDGTTVHTGDVWTFTTQVPSASVPAPAGDTSKLSGDKTPTSRSVWDAIKSGTFNRAWEHEPSGHVLLADNQFRMGARNGSRSSVVVFSNDDVEMAGNEIQSLTSRNLICTTLVRGFTVRVCHNRVSETLRASSASTAIARFLEMTASSGRASRLSLYTYAIMNMTAHNQTDHFIVARGLHEEQELDNQILYRSPSFKDRREIRTIFDPRDELVALQARALAGIDLLLKHKQFLVALEAKRLGRIPGDGKLPVGELARIRTEHLAAIRQIGAEVEIVKTYLQKPTAAGARVVGQFTPKAGGSSVPGGRIGLVDEAGKVFALASESAESFSGRFDANFDTSTMDRVDAYEGSLYLAVLDETGQKPIYRDRTPARISRGRTHLADMVVDATGSNEPAPITPGTSVLASTSDARPTNPAASTSDARPTGPAASTSAARPTGPAASASDARPTGPAASTSDARPTSPAASTSDARPTSPAASTSDARPTSPAASTSDARPTGPAASTSDARPTSPAASTSDARPTSPTGRTADARATSPASRALDSASREDDFKRVGISEADEALLKKNRITSFALLVAATNERLKGILGRQADFDAWRKAAAKLSGEDG